MKHRCPQCNKLIEYSASNKSRPFCCERCRMIDLGEWIEGKHSIPDDDHQDFEVTDPEFTRH